MRKKLWLITTISLLCLTVGLLVLINNNFANPVPVIAEINGRDDNDYLHWDRADDGWDDWRKSVSAYISLDIQDDNQNSLVYLCVSLSRSYYGWHTFPNGNQIDAVEYYGNSGVWTGRWKGRAQVRVDVPGAQNDAWKRENLGGAGEPTSVYVSGYSRRLKDGIGNRDVQVSARAFGIGTNIVLTASGF